MNTPTIPWQHLIPEPVLLHIFSFLEAKSLLRASCTCRKWHRVARDESLWKVLTKSNWNIQGGQKDSEATWYMEYKRLFYHAPTQFSERIEGHTDEVLDVAFSHNGRYFCTTSKDTKVKIWEVGNPTRLRHSADLGLALEWNMTQYAAFNSDDSYLLVCGVKFKPPSVGTQSLGLGVVFRMKDFRLLQEMPMDPPHLFADWYSNDICVGGYVTDAANNFFSVKAFKVIDDVPDKIPVRCPYEEGTVIYSFIGDPQRCMNLLVAKVPHTPANLPSVSDQCGNSAEETRVDSEQGSDLFKSFGEKCQVVAPTDHTRDCQNDIKKSVNTNSNSLVQEKKETSELGSKSSGDVCDNCGNTLSGAVLRYCTSCVLIQSVTMPVTGVRIPDPASLPTYDKYMLFVTREHHNTIAFHKVNDLPDILERRLKDKKRFEEMVRKAAKGAGTEGPTPTFTQLATPQNPNKSIHLPGHYISGMKLSPDNRLLYINCRYAIHDPEQQYPKLMEDMEVKTIDLQTFRLVPELKFGGHKGFSEFPAWYICLDSCQDYVASGSEEFLGYLWDRRYRTCLAKFQHCEGVVNGVAFDPVDQECLVTVADDHIINIWRSRNRKKQLEEHS